MAARQEWKLKRYGRFIPSPENGKSKQNHWKIVEDKNKESEIVLTILESGHLLIMRGQESLDTISLLCGSDSLIVQQKSDNLIFRLTVKGVNRVIRVQFDGTNREEATNVCTSAVLALRKYLSVTTLDATAHPNQPPMVTSVAATQPQQTCQEKPMETGVEIANGSLSVKHLAKHFLGEASLSFPQINPHSPLEQKDLEPILRVCLLDPSFPAFVESVEVNLKKLLQD